MVSITIWTNTEGRRTQAMRLTGGKTEREGRVEILSGSKWHTVCGEIWTPYNSAVVCRYLGFSDVIGGE